MILIADSGSTKTDWVLVNPNGDKVLKYNSMGFNPFFHDKNIVEAKLKEVNELEPYVQKVTQVFFYGAGCSSATLNKKIALGLKNVFNYAVINVNHDLLGAALSVYNGNPNITCILGTGSNCCYFDGNKTSQILPALGYVLGDEASGSYFGKKLLIAYLYKKLPTEISKDFTETYRLNKTEILKQVNGGLNPNVFLASFTKFIAKHRQIPFIKKMLFDGFNEYINIHVTCYKNHKHVALNFVGSIAYFFRDELQQTLQTQDLIVGNIIQKPIEGLVNYHVKKLTIA